MLLKILIFTVHRNSPEKKDNYYLLFFFFSLLLPWSEGVYPFFLMFSFSSSLLWRLRSVWSDPMYQWLVTHGTLAQGSGFLLVYVHEFLFYNGNQRPLLFRTSVCISNSRAKIKLNGSYSHFPSISTPSVVYLLIQLPSASIWCLWFD